MTSTRGWAPASWRWRSARRSRGGGRRSCGRRTSPPALTVVAMPFGLFAIGATPTEIALALLIVAVVLTGTSFLLVSSGPFATAGMTASSVAAVLTPGDASVLVSVALVILGAQVALEGLVRSRLGLDACRCRRRSRRRDQHVVDDRCRRRRARLVGAPRCHERRSRRGRRQRAVARRRRLRLESPAAEQLVDGGPGDWRAGGVAPRRPADARRRLERAAGPRRRRRRRRRRRLAAHGRTADHRHGHRSARPSWSPPGRSSPSWTRGCGWPPAVSG